MVLMMGISETPIIYILGSLYSLVGLEQCGHRCSVTSRMENFLSSIVVGPHGVIGQPHVCWTLQWMRDFPHIVSSAEDNNSVVHWWDQQISIFL